MLAIVFEKLERAKRFELSTPTLARHLLWQDSGRTTGSPKERFEVATLVGQPILNTPAVNGIHAAIENTSATSRARPFASMFRGIANSF